MVGAQGNEQIFLPYFAACKWRASTSDQQFFIKASTAEAIGDLLFPKMKLMPPEEWGTIQSQLTQAIPEKWRMTLSDRLEFVGRPIFVERLNALVKMMPIDLRCLVLG